MIRNGCSPHEYYAEAPKSFFGCCLPIDKYRNIQIVNIWRLLILVHCVWRVRWTCRICDMRYASLIHKAIECVIFPFFPSLTPCFFFCCCSKSIAKPMLCHMVYVFEKSTFQHVHHGFSHLTKVNRKKICLNKSLVQRKMSQKWLIAHFLFEIGIMMIVNKLRLKWHHYFICIFQSSTFNSRYNPWEFHYFYMSTYGRSRMVTKTAMSWGHCRHKCVQRKHVMKWISK